jgi:hypothetical protein
MWMRWPAGVLRQDLQKKSFRTSAGTVEKVRWIHPEYCGGARWNADDDRGGQQQQVAKRETAKRDQIRKYVSGSHAGQSAILIACAEIQKKKIEWQDSFTLENVDIPYPFQEIYPRSGHPSSGGAPFSQRRRQIRSSAHDAITAKMETVVCSNS